MCLDEGQPFLLEFLGERTTIRDEPDCGQNPGSLEFGPQAQHFTDGGLAANPDGRECLRAFWRTKIHHCCDADSQDMAVEIRGNGCCIGPDLDGNGYPDCHDACREPLPDPNAICDASFKAACTNCNPVTENFSGCDETFATYHKEGESAISYIGGGQCLAEPKSIFESGLEINLALSVEEFIEPIPATTRIGAVLLVVLLLGSTVYFFIRRRRVTE